MKSDKLLEATIKALIEGKSLVTKQNNRNKLRENKKIEAQKLDKSNGVPDEMYKIADNIYNSIKNKDFLNRDDFEDLLFKNAHKILGVTNYDEMLDEFPDIDNTVREILGYRGWDTDVVEGDLSTNPEKYFELDEGKRVEAKRIDKSNGVPEAMYEIADNILNSISGKDFLSKDDFEDLLFKNAQKVLDVTTYEEMNDEFPDIDNTVREILSFSSWDTDFVKGDLSTNPEKYFLN